MDKSVTFSSYSKEMHSGGERGERSDGFRWQLRIDISDHFAHVDIKDNDNDGETVSQQMDLEDFQEFCLACSAALAELQSRQKT